jgi:O-succinylbenzoic acid--CoA ligase
MDINEFLNEWQNDSDTVWVHTSGSTGKPKPMQVEKRRMEASARITCDFLGLKEGDTALLCMSLDYIAGKMMVVRALTCGLRLISAEPKGCPQWEGAIDFAAMVPMQVWNLVQQAPERLRQIRHLIIGGGAISDELADALKDMPNHIWSTYGMTETLSHIALRRLNGVERSEWYTPFDGVEVSLNEEECLVIHAPAVHEGILVTNDIAELKDGKFRIKGRKDNVVCSGGIKIQREEVERMLSAHLKVPFLITKKADKKFGEQVVLLTESIDVSNVKEVCQQVLPRYWQPRMYLHVAKIPLTETGKPARAEAEKMVRTQSKE